MSGFSKAYKVLDLLYGRSAVDVHLAASVDAVSLAFYSFHFRCTAASHVARESYLHALPLLNGALKSPESARSDSSLLAVLLLDLFEKITNRNPRSTDSWMSHVNGALVLVKLRDRKQLADYISLQLSVRLSTNLLISCIAANTPVPSGLVKLRSDLEPFLNKDDPKWKVSGLVVKYCNLQGALQERRISGFDVITKVTELDHEFISLAENMPSTWRYSTMHLEEASERVLGRHFDMYPDHFTAQTWNVLRVMRILLNDIIRKYRIERATEWDEKGTSRKTIAGWTDHSGGISPDIPSMLPENLVHSRSEIATHTIDDLAKVICATAPQLTVHGRSLRKSKNYSELQKLRCYTVLFPLYVAAFYASSMTKIKPWVIEQLRFISNEIGISNASEVAAILERAEETSPWSVYAILGSYAFAA